MKRRLRVAAAALVVGSVMAAVLAGSSPARPGAKNPFGLTVVRFAQGTTTAAMQAAVTNAGGEVVGELDGASAVSVLSSRADFGSRIVRQPGVLGQFRDRAISGLSQPDRGRGGSRGHDDEPKGGRHGDGLPDPWHDATSFLGETNPEGILQWDDARMNVPAAWSRATGDHVDVAVIDTGVDRSHRELRSVVDRERTMIPCRELAAEYGWEFLQSIGLTDCGLGDLDGHGTWVSSRLAGAGNGFASNGVAPGAEVSSYKVVAAGFGTLSSWIVSGILQACHDGADVVNLSLGNYVDPDDPESAEDYLTWVDAVNYCRAHGALVLAAAGNEHVRIDRVDLTVGGRLLKGVGRVSTGPDGIGTPLPGQPLEELDLRGALQLPAGVPGVVMVSATNNANGQAPRTLPAAVRPPASYAGRRDQLAYYSNYGSRVDLAAPGGARKYNIPLYDGGDGDILYGGWGSLAALPAASDLCTGSTLVDAACFRSGGNGFGWLQGTSVAVPNAAGVAALTLSAHRELRGRPDALLARLQSTAKRTMANATGPNDPLNTAAGANGVACTAGYCHLDYAHPIPFNSAYGAGLVDAGRAVR